MTPIRLAFTFIGISFALSFWSSGASAQDTALTVLSHSDGITGEVRYTIDELEALPQKTVKTTNEFVDGLTEFSGPLARVILKLTNDINAETVSLIAANDYEIEVPVEDFRKYDVIFATKQNGKQLSRRDKGPIWVIYPMTDHRELQDSIYNQRLIWQLVRMEVVKN